MCLAEWCRAIIILIMMVTVNSNWLALSATLIILQVRESASSRRSQEWISPRLLALVANCVNALNAYLHRRITAFWILVMTRKSTCDLLLCHSRSISHKAPHGKIPELTISLKGVHDQLSKINTSKSQGPDGIPPWFLNRYAYHLTPIIHDIFQSSVDSGQVPKAWNEANITAIFKKGNRAETSNYRPISLTPVISKLLEHIIHSHIMKHLEQHHILTDHQHGHSRLH